MDGPGGKQAFAKSSVNWCSNDTARIGNVEP